MLLLTCYQQGRLLHSAAPHSHHTCCTAVAAAAAAAVSTAHVRCLLDAACLSACREAMLEEEGRLVRLLPRAAVRSLNGKAVNETGVIWTVRLLEYLVVNAGRSRP